MLPRIHLPDDFRGWRIACLVVSLCLFGLSAFATRLGAYTDNLAAMMGVFMLVVGLFVGGAISGSLSLSGLIARPATRLFGHLFYPEETIKEPPKELLFALRMRLRDRYWDSVDQQTRELIRAYGPSPELYHLRALMEGGRSGNHSAVTVEASKKLSGPAFDRYTALLRRDPPPREIQTGIEA